MISVITCLQLGCWTLTKSRICELVFSSDSTIRESVLKISGLGCRQLEPETCYSLKTCRLLNTAHFYSPLMKRLTHKPCRGSTDTDPRLCEWLGFLVALSPLVKRFDFSPPVPWPVDVQASSADVGRLSEQALPPGVVVDQAGAALYGLPPALAVQGLHIGFGHHHFGVGETDAWLVLGFYRPAEESTGSEAYTWAIS